MDIKNCKKSLEYIFAIGRTPNIIGKHGIGKSSIVYEFAKENGYEVIEIRLGQMADAGDLIGLQEFIEDQTTGHKIATRHVLPEWFPRTGQKKKILFLDELNRAPKDIQQAIFELVYDKRLKGVKMGEDCHVVAACNPATEDYSVMSFEDSAFQDRFVHLSLKPSAGEFFSYGKDKGLSGCVIDFLQTYPKMLENQDLKDFELDFVKPSRRSWEAVAHLRSVVPEGEKDIFQEMVMGLVGREAAVAYKIYAETHATNITAEEVLKDYESVKEKHIRLQKLNRADIVANILEDLSNEFGKRGEKDQGLTLAEAENLIAFMENLNAEQKFSLGIVIRDNPNCCRKVDGMPKGGLFESEKIEQMLIKTKKLRDEARAKAESKKKNNDDVPF